MIFNIVIILINIIIFSVMYIILIRRIDRRTDPESISESIIRDLDLVLAEINQATDRNIMLIEDKLKELNSTVEKAEARIKLLKKNEMPKTEVRVEEPKKDELTYSTINKITNYSGIVSTVKSQVKTEDGVDSKKRIIELYKSGLDSGLIAASLGVNRGEVELIISLYRQSNNIQD